MALLSRVGDRDKLPIMALGLVVCNYGMTHWHQLFTERQLTALTVFSDLLSEVRSQIAKDGASGRYADAVCTYLSLAIGRLAEMLIPVSWWHNHVND